MPDISMCEGKGCPLKNKCYRYTAVPNEYRQSYFVNPPYDFQLESCDYYWDNTPDEEYGKNRKT